MAWMIIRIEEKDATYREKVKTYDKPDMEQVITQLPKRHKNQEPTMSEYEALLNKHGFELGPFIGKVTREEMARYPYTAYCYVSPRKDGWGRGCSTLHRWPVRRID